MTAKFGTSGLRGLVGELTDGTAAAHATAFARHLKTQSMVRDGSSVYLARDMRASSPEIARQCAAALASEGLIPVDCGVAATPALAHYAMDRGAAALMVTGSHIPDDRNGVKFYRPDGEIDKKDEAAIAGLAAFSRNSVSGVEATRMRDESAPALRAFIARYRGFVPDGEMSGLRIGLYEHSSAVSDALAAILEALNVEVVRLGKSERFIPVDTEAVSSETRDRTSLWVRDHRLDGLVSADGDGDRPLLVDDSGVVVRGDVLGLIAARYLKADAVVTPVTSNSGLELNCEARIFRTRVGSPYVIAGMKAALEQGCLRVIGFEANGGVLTGNRIRAGSADLTALPTRDSVLPILCALAAARATGARLSSFVEGLALPVAASDRIENFPTARSQALVSGLSADVAACTRFFEPFGEIAEIDRTDGLRITLNQGRILHLRPSGNAPEMRVYSEAENAAEANRLIGRMIALITGTPSS